MDDRGFEWQRKGGTLSDETALALAIFKRQARTLLSGGGCQGCYIPRR